MLCFVDCAVLEEGCQQGYLFVVESLLFVLGRGSPTRLSFPTKYQTSFPMPLEE